MPTDTPVWCQSSLTCIETPLRLALPAHMDFVLTAVRQAAVFLKRLTGIYRSVTADYPAMLFISNFVRRTTMVDMDE